MKQLSIFVLAILLIIFGGVELWVLIIGIPVGFGIIWLCDKDTFNDMIGN